MSISDQEQDQKPDRRPEPVRDTGPTEDAGRARDAGPSGQTGPAEQTGPAGDAAPVSAGEQDVSPDDVPGAAGAPEGRLTPRQARRLRVVLSSVGMAAMAVVLALRIASRSSVLVVGVYGLALILCGVVIELSRNGRTRLGSWLLAVGLVAAVGADWLLIP
ncbi:hypothetical protein AB0D35_09120 [Streptomyces sp. NPDC048301]|uniref:hypothetical protein n=1 Tax=unclassified Streptomyces TaxID=2593676 RepID=UPI003436DC9A